MTPKTAAVIAASAPDSALLAQTFSMHRPPRNIQRKHGAKVTQVERTPPSTPASSGGMSPGERNAAMNPTNCKTMMSRPGVHLECSPLSVFGWREPMVSVDSLLGDISENRVSAAEGDDRHFAEEHGDLGEDVIGAGGQ